MIPGLRLADRLASSPRPARITLILAETSNDNATALFARTFSPSFSSPDVAIVSTRMAYDAASFGWDESIRSPLLKSILASLIPDSNTGSPAFKAATIGERVGRVAAALATAAQALVDASGVPDVVVYETFSSVGADLASRWGVPGVLLSSAALSLESDSWLLPSPLSTSLQVRNHPPSLFKRTGMVLASLVLPPIKHLIMEAPQAGFRAQVGLPPGVPSVDDVLNTYGHIVLETMVPPLGVSRLQHPNVFPVGPLGPVSGDKEENNNSGGGVWDWLEGRAEGSVVFVSLGSHVLPSEIRVASLVSGLRALVEEQDGLSILWARGSVIATAFPHLAEAMEHPRIRMEGFVAQSQILHSPSVGVFISHCGAGAIGEGVLAAVPFVAVPIALDQPANAARAVEAGIAVSLDLETASPGDVADAVRNAQGKRDMSRAVRTLVLAVGGADRAVDLVHTSADVGNVWVVRSPTYLSWPHVVRSSMDVGALLVLLVLASRFVCCN